MESRYKGRWIVLGLLAIVVIWFVASYNRFVSLDNAVKTQWAQVETTYQTRLDLIPNVVATVKGISRQEQKVFGDLAEARTRYAGAKTIDERALAAGQVETSLARLLVVVENYPNLQSSQSYRDLTVELEGTENRIRVERQRYNDQVRSYNIAIARFPANLAAKLFGYQEHQLFQAASGAEQAPKVDFTQ